MLKMVRNKGCLLLFLQIFIAVNGQGYYSVVAPGAIRASSKYNVAVSIHKADSTTPVKLSISDEENKVSLEKTVQAEPYSTNLVTFDIPADFPKGSYKLTAESESGLQFKNSTKLYFEDKDKSVFIQTDKAIYKPGDIVKFRILVLDYQLRPLELPHGINVTIEDSEDNDVLPIKSAKLVNGIYENQLQLSNYPVLGNWKIKVQFDPDTHTKTFEVAEYVLPRFEVMIEIPDEVVVSELRIPVIVRAQYTYGKYVDGEAKITLMDYYDSRIIEEKTAPLKGKASVQFDCTCGAKWYFPDNIKVKAEVTEKHTGAKYHAIKDLRIYRKKFSIEGIKIPENFLFDTAQEVKVKITNNRGTPIPNHPKPLKLKVTDGYPPKAIFEENQFAGEDGTATFSMNFSQPESYSETDTYGYSGQIETDDAYSYSFYLRKRRENPADKLLIEILDEKLSTNNKFSVRVTSPQNMKYFIYQVVSRGIILKSEKIEVPSKKEYVFEIVPTPEMSPSSDLFIYYIFEGNLVFAEKKLNFADELPNSIKVKLPAESNPGKDIDITVLSNPGSYIGLLGVDQSVLLKKSGNDLSLSDVMGDVRVYNTRTYYPEVDPDEFPTPPPYPVPIRPRESLAEDDASKTTTVAPEDQVYYRKVRDYDKPYPGESSGVVTLTNADFPYWKIVEYRPWSWHPDTVYYSPLSNRGGVAHVAHEEAFIAHRPLTTRLPHPGLPGPPGFVGGQGRPIMKAGSSSEPVTITVRKEFPETWLWEFIPSTSENEVTIHKKVPDTITSWVITGFSLNPEKGLGLTESAKKLRVFQPFFATANLPYSVKNGEVITIPVAVFNYLNEDLTVDVTLNNEEGLFEFINPENSSPTNEDKQTKQVTAAADSAASVSFTIRPKKVGNTPLKILAISKVAGDEVTKILKVEPEGIKKNVNKAVLLEAGSPEQKFDITIPENVVPDSANIEISVTGNMLGPIVKNLHNLIRYPSGCGEQNMVNFVPNYLVLRYLETTNQLNSRTERMAKNYLQSGYQRELRYKHPDGSFSAFGTSDKSGCTWFTAYVARSFRHASKYTSIDEKVINASLAFLVKNQAEDGSFPEVGVIVDRKYAIGGEGIIVLTAFTLLTLLDNAEKYPEYADNIKKGVDYLIKNVDSTDDVFSLAVAAYALQLANHEKKNALREKLLSRTKNEDGKTWWTTQVSNKKSSVNRNADVELTSYALLTLLEADNEADTLPIVKWLITKRNSNGGFGSTQDTVVGLQALIKYVEKHPSSNEIPDVSFKTDQGDEGKITNEAGDAILLQTHVLSPNTRQVTVDATGKGSALVQISYKYNIPTDDEPATFTIDPQVNLTGKRLELKVCVKYAPQEGEDKTTNMAVMEVTLPSGYLADKENFSTQKGTNGIKKIDTKDDDTTVIFYFDNLTTENVCPQVVAFKEYQVSKQKPAPIFVYDYYDNARQAKVLYNAPETSICETCEGDNCDDQCKNN